MGRSMRTVTSLRSARALLATVVVLAGLGVAACTATPAQHPATTAVQDGPTQQSSTREVATPKKATVSLPPVNGRFDYQIGGPYAPVASVAVISRDRHEQPVTGRYGICYVNAFQTQPQEAKFWTGKHPDLLLRRDGKPLIDPDWPGEYILDTSTTAKRSAIAAIVGGWITGCARSGFQAVEPDNLDAWTRSKGLLTKADNVALATLLATRAHSVGLAIAQKNTSELGSSGRTKIGFDFAIAEECQVYDECAAYTNVYGARVIEIEYTDNPRKFYTRACAARGASIAVILRDRDVVAKGQPDYRYEAC